MGITYGVLTIEANVDRQDILTLCEIMFGAAVIISYHEPTLILP